MIFEICGARCLLFIELSQRRFVRIGQRSAGAHEIAIVSRDEETLAGVQLEGGATVEHALDAFEQRVVEVDRVTVRG